MVITTKYDVGDEVYFLYHDKVRFSKIKQADSYQKDLSDFNWVLEYTVGTLGKSFLELHESQLFRTKQELIDSL